MRLKLREGDYVPDNLGGFQRTEGKEALLEAALFCLAARRGCFGPLPELGSRLYTLQREKPGNYGALAKKYAQEALRPLGLEVTEVTLRQQSDCLYMTVEACRGEETVLLEAEIA